MKTDYAVEKRTIMSQLQQARNRMGQLETDYSLELKELRDKIATGIDNLAQEKFRMAFFGSFSDGKSTLLSALTRRLDIEIAPQPTTDRVATYEYGDYLIVDTPGLHSENTMHDETTKKFISEANVVIFAVDAVNPLRESHRDTIQWLLTDLNKLDATIFVLNKMDSVADLEDEKNFNDAAEIKIKALVETLNRHLQTVSSPLVVPVSADPYGMGLSHWLEHEKEYLKLSRIGDLTRSLDAFVVQAKSELIIRSGLSVLSDAVVAASEEIKRVALQAESAAGEKKVELEQHRKDVGDLEQEISRKNRAIREDLLQLREEVILGLRGASTVEELRDHVSLKIGNDGSILSERVNIIIQNHTDELMDKEYELFSEIDETLKSQLLRNEQFHKMLGDAGVKAGEKILCKSTRQLAGTVKSFRDLLSKTGIKIKFKPWGALKCAKRLQKFGKLLKGMPVILEALQTALRFNEERKFKKERQKIEAALDRLFKDIRDDLSLENFRKDYFLRAVAMAEALEILMEQQLEHEKFANNLKLAASELSGLLAIESREQDDNPPQIEFAA